MAGQLATSQTKRMGGGYVLSVDVHWHDGPWRGQIPGRHSLPPRRNSSGGIDTSARCVTPRRGGWPQEADTSVLVGGGQATSWRLRRSKERTTPAVG